MDRDERQRADDLDRFWDALLDEDDLALTAGSASDLARTVKRLHTATSFRPLFPIPSRHWPEVRRTARLKNSSGEVSAVARSPFIANGRGQHDDQIVTVSRSRRLPGGWLANQLATAALLLVTLAVGLLALLHESRGRQVDAIPTPAMVRALETSSPGIVDTPLVEARFLPEELPTDDVEAIFYRLTLDPGMVLSTLAGPSCGCPGGYPAKAVGVEVVEAGAYSIHMDAPIRVQRAGVTTRSDMAPAGVPVTLGPGDAAIFPDYVAPVEIRSLGTEPVVLAGVVILEWADTGTTTEMLPVGAYGELISQSIAYDWKELPAGPIALTLRRLTLPAGTTIGPYAPIGLESVRVEAGQISRQYFKRGMSEPAGPVHSTYEKYAIPFNNTAPGVRVAFSSSADNAAELLVAIIEPAGLWPGALAP